MINRIRKSGVSIRSIVSYSDSLLYNLNKYIANILKAYVKNENRNAKSSTMFPNCTRNEDEVDGTMESFGITSFYTDIPKIDLLNMMIMLIMMISVVGKLLYLKTSFLI